MPEAQSQEGWKLYQRARQLLQEGARHRVPPDGPDRLAALDRARQLRDEVERCFRWALPKAEHDQSLLARLAESWAHYDAQTYRKALGLEPDNQAILRHLGRCLYYGARHYVRGKETWDEASLSRAREVLERATEDADGMALLSSCCSRAGELEQASRWLGRAQALSMDAIEVQRARETLDECRDARSPEERRAARLEEILTGKTVWVNLDSLEVHEEGCLLRWEGGPLVVDGLTRTLTLFLDRVPRRTVAAQSLQRLSVFSDSTEHENKTAISVSLTLWGDNGPELSLHTNFNLWDEPDETRTQHDRVLDSCRTIARFLQLSLEEVDQRISSS